MNEPIVKYLGQVEGAATDIRAFSVRWMLKPTTIAEAKLRGIPDQIDLETTASLRFHIRGERLVGLSEAQILEHGRLEALKLMRVIVQGRLDTNGIMA